MKSWHIFRAKNEEGRHFNPTRFMIYFWWRDYHYALVYGHLVEEVGYAMGVPGNWYTPDSD